MIPLWKSPIKLPVELPVELPMELPVELPMELPAVKHQPPWPVVWVLLACMALSPEKSPQGAA